MSWIKLDDQWMDHPKIIRAGRDARDVWLASITWCAKHLTDGYFPGELLPSLCVSAGVDVANCQTFATTLVQVCLWDATPNGYMVHDYLDYNPTKEQTLNNRQVRKAAGSAGGKAKASKMASKTLAKSYQNSAPSPSPTPLIDPTTTTPPPPVSNARYPIGTRVVIELAQWGSIPEGQVDKIDGNLSALTLRFPQYEGLKEYCAPYASEYYKRYPARTSAGWLDWAAMGQIPPEKTPAKSNGRKQSDHKPEVYTGVHEGETLTI